MKIYITDYLRRRVKERFANLISIMRLIIEFSLFYLTPTLSKLEREK